MRERHSAILTTAILAAATMAACADAGEDEAELDTGADTSAMEATVSVDGAEVPAFSTVVRTQFSPTEAVGGVSGTLRLLVPTQEAPEDEPLRLVVELAGLEPGPHAWHVRRGSCEVGEPGEVLVPFTPTAEQEGVAEPLVADEQGRAHAEVPLPPLDALRTRAGQYSVHVHRKAGVEHGPSVACADL